MVVRPLSHRITVQPTEMSALLPQEESSGETKFEHLEGPMKRKHIDLNQCSHNSFRRNSFWGPTSSNNSLFTPSSYSMRQVREEEIGEISSRDSRSSSKSSSSSSVPLEDMEQLNLAPTPQSQYGSPPPSRTKSVLLLNSWGGKDRDFCIEVDSKITGVVNENGSYKHVTPIRRPRAFSLGAESSSPERCACGKEWIVKNNLKMNMIRSNSCDDNDVDMEDMSKPSKNWDEKELVAELKEGTPKVVLSPYIQQDDLQRIEPEMNNKEPGICETCKSPSCLTVKPTLGFYKKEQVEKHCRPDDCWITAHGVVYDVTRYVAKHPGGAQSILRLAGQDASYHFDFHSSYSKKKIWIRYKIGQLAYCNGKSEDENCVIC